MIGTTLTHYRITAKLGEGGMGEVYRATDTRLGRDVAIKVLPASISRDRLSLARFEREAKALAALNHPHIAAIYGFDSDQGTYFLVLELVEGETLSERLRRRPVPLQEALALARQMAEALQEAHEKGIIHRDLKPGNVKITPNGRVKVLDFGLAKIERAFRSQTGSTDAQAAEPDASTMQAETTLPGAVMGTPAYMSPEQARGLEADKRTDIWAFGCCLYECLSGRKPFQGQTPSDLMAEVLKSEPDWSQIPAETPREVLALLRRCLEKEPSRRLSGMGDIAIMLDESTRGSRASSLSQTPQAPASAPASPLSNGTSAKRPWPALAGLFFLIIVGGTYLWKRPGLEHNSQAGPDVTKANRVPISPPATPVAAPVIDQKSVAVLAFENLSNDKDNEYFCDGISEELGNVLGKVPGLRVPGRTSTFFFKGKKESPAEIAKQLDVAYLVQGSVRKSGTRVRITAQLTKAADGFQVWTDDFERESQDIFAVQDEIAGLVAQHLRLKLGVPRTGKTVNPEAHRLVLEGLHFWYLRTEDDFTRAEDAFKRALEFDPEFALAHAGLANNYVIRASYRLIDGVDGADSDLANGRVEAQRAIELDPNIAEAHAALAYALLTEGHWADSEKYFQTTLRLSPNYAMAMHWYSLVLSSQGRLDLGLEELRKAEELDPLAFITINAGAETRMFARRYEDALATNDRAAHLREKRYLRNLGNRAELLTLLGRTNDAVEVAHEIRQDQSPRTRWVADAYAVWALAKAGLAKEAAEYADERKTKLGGESYVRGFVLVALGRFNEALPYLAHTPVNMWRFLYWDVLFDPYRDDPGFQQLLVKLNCANEYKVARETLARMLKEQDLKRTAHSADQSQ
jgi:serine/threonine-protein kinase